MSYVFRKLQAGHQFFTQASALAGAPFAALPLSIIQEFVPRHVDRGWLSCFVTDDPTTAGLLNVAAAMDVSTASGGRGQHYIGVDRPSLAAVGIGQRLTRGGTFHDLVDGRHIELNIPDLPTLDKVVGLFLSGVPVEIAKGSVVSQSSEDVRAGAFSFQRAAFGNRRSPVLAAAMERYVRDGDLWAVGAQAAADRFCR